MISADHIHQRSGNIRTVRLTRDDLLELDRLLRESFPKNDTTTHVSIHLSATQVDENSMSAFLSNPNIPDEIEDQFLIIMYENVVGRTVSDTRFLQIQIYQNLKISFFSVRGEEKNWVIGTHKVLADFFQSRRMPFSFVRKTVRKSYDMLQAIIDGNILTLSIVLTVCLLIRQVPYSFVTLLLLAFWSFLARLYERGLIFKPILISPKQAKKAISRDDIAFYSGIVATVATIVAAIPTIIAFFALVEAW